MKGFKEYTTKLKSENLDLEIIDLIEECLDENLSTDDIVVKIIAFVDNRYVKNQKDKNN